MQCSREVFGEKSFEKLSTVVWYELFLLRTLDFIGRVFSVNTMGEETTFGACRHRVFSLTYGLCRLYKYTENASVPA